MNTGVLEWTSCASVPVSPLNAPRSNQASSVDQGLGSRCCYLDNRSWLRHSFGRCSPCAPARAAYLPTPLLDKCRNLCSLTVRRSPPSRATTAPGFVLADSSRYSTRLARSLRWYPRDWTRPVRDGLVRLAQIWTQSHIHTFFNSLEDMVALADKANSS